MNNKISVFSTIKSFFKDTVVYGIINSISKFINILILPLITQTYSKKDYGTYELLTITISIFVVLGIFGQQATVARFFFETKTNKHKSKIISSSLFISIIFTLCVLVIGNIFIKLYDFETSIINNFPILILSLIVLLTVIKNEITNILRFLYDKNGFLFVNIGYLLTFLILIFIFVKILKLDIRYVFYAQFLSLILIIVYSFFRLKKYINFKFLTYKDLKPLVNYGLPYMFIALISILTPTLNKFIINYNYGIESMADYSVVTKIVVILTLITQSFQLVWPTFAFSLYKKDNANKVFSTIINYYLFILFFFSTLILLNIKFIISIISIKYYFDQLPIVLVLLLFSVIFSSLTYVVSLGLDIEKKNFLNLKITLFSVIISTLAIYILVPRYGLIGAAISNIIYRINVVILRLYFSNKYSNIKFDEFKMFLLFIIFSILFYTIIHFNFSGVYYSFLLLSSVLLLFWLFIIDKNEKIKIKQLIKKINN